MRLGTLAPERRASDRPMAIACFRLVTRLPERPLRKVPRFRSCIARFTFDCAFCPYLGMMLASTQDIRVQNKCQVETLIQANGTEAPDSRRVSGVL